MGFNYHYSPYYDGRNDEEPEQEGDLMAKVSELSNEDLIQVIARHTSTIEEHRAIETESKLALKEALNELSLRYKTGKLEPESKI